MLIEYQHTFDDLREANIAVARANRLKKPAARAIGFAVSLVGYYAVMGVLGTVGNARNVEGVWINLIIPIGALMLLSAVIGVATLIRGRQRLRFNFSMLGWLLFAGLVGFNFWLFSSGRRSGATTTWSWTILWPHTTWLFLVAWIGYSAIRNQARSLQKNWDDQPNLQRPKTADISVHGITISDQVSRCECAWTAFLRLQETDRLFLLYVAQSACHILPKRAFQGDEAMNAFRAMARMIDGNQPIGFPVAQAANEPMQLAAEPGCAVQAIMNFRTLTFRIMLGALGAAAAAGACTVFASNYDVIGRVVLTALATASAAGLMLSVTKFIDRPGWRSASILAMGVVLAEYLLSLSLIWYFSFLSSGNEFEQVGLTMVHLAATGIPAVSLLRLRARPSTRIAAITGIAITCVALVLLMVCTWRNSSWSTDEQIWETAMALAGTGALAVGCVVGLGTDRRHWRWAGVVAAAVSFAAVCEGIWGHPENGEFFFAVVLTVAIVVSYANLVVRIPLKGGQRWLLIGTLVATILTAAGVDAVVYLNENNQYRDTDLASRLAAACGIIAGCGTLALVVLSRLNRRVATTASLPGAITEITVICPSCQKKQAIPVGKEAACGGCGLKISVKVDEPRCPNCNYLLYMLSSDRCPECGTVVVR